jgi:SAM-dependent methyltransferase
MINRIKNRLAMRFYEAQNQLLQKRFGLNSKLYWDSRFQSNWENISGRLQSAYFAAGFAAARIDIPRNIESVVDYGCGLGDSLPILRSMFPQASISFYDVSTVAMADTKKRFAQFATPLAAFDDNKRFDLVYCSNVIEHISDSTNFMTALTKLADKYIVIQAPYKEKHLDGSRITGDRPKGEHIVTIDDQFISNGDYGFQWHSTTGIVPFAWDDGEQIFFIGRRIEDPKETTLGVSILPIQNGG